MGGRVALFIWQLSPLHNPMPGPAFAAQVSEKQSAGFTFWPSLSVFSNITDLSGPGHRLDPNYDFWHWQYV